MRFVKTKTAENQNSRKPKQQKTKTAKQQNSRKAANLYGISS